MIVNYEINIGTYLMFVVDLASSLFGNEQYELRTSLTCCSCSWQEKKKNVLNDFVASLGKKIHIHIGKDGVLSSVLENWFDLIIKQGGEDHFKECVWKKNEIFN